MKVKIGNRMRLIRKKLDLSQKEMANKLNISSSYLSDVELNKAGMSLDKLSNLIIQFNINLNWLLIEKGTMFNLDKELSEKDIQILDFLNTNSKLKQVIEKIRNSSYSEYILYEDLCCP